MIILGIANAETASACIVREGELIAAASEERFSRKKMDSAWPGASIAYCLEHAGVSLSELDLVAYGWGAGFDADKHLLTYFDRIVHETRHNPEGLQIFRERIAVEIDRDRIKQDEFWGWIDQHDLRARTVSVDHHLAHAFSAYSCSPFDEALVLTCDGRGDFTALSVMTFDRDSVQELYRGTSTDSLGFFYGRITQLLGFRPHRHEGKVTGLAAHGDPSKLLPVMEEMIGVENGKLIARCGELFRPFYSRFSDKLKGIIQSHSREDVAAAAQKHLENCLESLADYYVRQTGAKYVGLAGGVFANVCVNQRILELDGVENVFIQPQMSDGGLCIGAAAQALHERGVPHIQTENMYLGPEYDAADIEKALQAQSRIEWHRPDDLIAEAIEHIENNQVIGWFQGRMEFGPRALCHRSIIYHCRDRSANDWLNKRMSRTEFMPFAPVTAEELAPQCYIGWKPDHIAAHYMTITYDCTEVMKKGCPAAVHIDGTARPQVVQQGTNPLMHEFLTRYHEKTGELSLINTSFNRHEEPIVNNPEEAIDALDKDIVDVLVIGPFVAKRKT
jgi:carbamoyltransferase